MTREEIAASVIRLVSTQFGDGRHIAVVDPAKNLQDCFGCTSLEIVSFQMSIEEEFALKFATGNVDRGAIDAEWDKLTSLAELTDFVVRWTSQK